ncbi:MAG: aldo/keto reductase [Atopobiaceae bacterium]|jgi:2,5-diketo-D-gluconate reductase A
MQDVVLNGGSSMPQVGFGTFNIPKKDTQAAVEQALELGYRHLDCATAYLNEKEVGQALRASGMADEVFVTTKLRNCDQGRDNVRRAFELSCERLGKNVLDLYLIHWPCPAHNTYVETWQEFIELQKEGAVKEIGVSNFLVEHLDRLLDETGVVPAVNQIESHPHFWQPEVESWCKEHGVVVEAYQPLGRGRDIESEPVVRAAEDHKKSAAQVVLRWHVQMGHVIVPKSVHVERMKQNMDLFDFELTDQEMSAICALHSENARLSGDPHTFENSQDDKEMAALIKE